MNYSDLAKSDFAEKISRERLAYYEKIALAKLEESKANQRVRELQYQLARFELEADAQFHRMMAAN